ncbi:MAG: rod shape-determining protein [Puniceicoccales bacterium]|jgi:rod shape-determining protein MreB|nr:rod shape-determining protein [Puniceicoccales bacterium]
MIKKLYRRLHGKLGRALGFFSHDLGIDLGTANTLVYARDRGIVLNEPSVVALYSDSRKVRAVGEEAKSMLGRTPGNIVATRPMKDGVIADFDVTEAMLRYFIAKACRSARFVAPRVVVAVPSGITEVERRAVKESAMNAGAREVLLLQEPVAAAIGVGLPIEEPVANMIVDIGGGTTEVAVISLSGVVYARSLRVGGDAMDLAIVNYLKRAHNLLIGERTAEETKIRIGSAMPLDQECSIAVRGRDTITGLPQTVQLTSQEVREALGDSLNAIADMIRSTLERCPPELSSDLVNRGFALAGGGALIRKIDQMLRQRTSLPVFVADEPLWAVANGTGAVIQNLTNWIKAGGSA